MRRKTRQGRSSKNCRHIAGSAYRAGAFDFTVEFVGVRVAQALVLHVAFCILLSFGLFLFVPVRCQFIFN